MPQNVVGDVYRIVPTEIVSSRVALWESMSGISGNPGYLVSVFIYGEEMKTTPLLTNLF